MDVDCELILSLQIFFYLWKGEMYIRIRPGISNGSEEICGYLTIDVQSHVLGVFKTDPQPDHIAHCQYIP
jgi:hypothetical protein